MSIERRQTNFDNPSDPVLLEIQGQVRDIWELLNGRDGKFGLNAKVGIMWRMHGWLILGIGVVIGEFLHKWVG